MKENRQSYGADPKYPIRMSSLNSMMSCPMMAYQKWRERMLQTANQSQYVSSHSGTALGLMIELFHRGDSRERATKRVKDASEIGMGDRPHPFPRADWETVTKTFERYVSDPRNNDPRNPVIVESLEKEVKLELKDIKGKPIYFEGHLDQARMTEDDFWEVWDIKFSEEFTPAELLATKIPQLGFYVLGLMNEGIDATIGGIIAPRQYITKMGKNKAPGTSKGSLLGVLGGRWMLRPSPGSSPSKSPGYGMVKPLSNLADIVTFAMSGDPKELTPEVSNTAEKSLTSNPPQSSTSTKRKTYV